MPYYCSVADCKNNSKNCKENELIFHRFPKSPELIQQWSVKCKRADSFRPETSRICSDHFVCKDYETNLQNELLGLPSKKKFKSTAVPSVFKLRSLNTVQDNSLRCQRFEKKARKRLIDELLSTSCEEGKQINNTI